MLLRSKARIFVDDLILDFTLEAMLVSSKDLTQVIYQTPETVFHRDIRTPRRELKYNAQRSIFDEIRGVWTAHGTLSRVFDICSQSKQKLKSKRTSKIVKSYAN